MPTNNSNSASRRLISLLLYSPSNSQLWRDDSSFGIRQNTTAEEVIKRGFDDTEPARQRYACHNCDKRFDDLTNTIFAGHHQPLKVWVLCLYFMGLNVSNEQIAHELSIHESDAYQMTTALRGGIIKKSQP
jgi:transposase-like protein